eukprot:1966243-Pyramimonas_sp.AAC.1
MTSLAWLNDGDVLRGPEALPAAIRPNLARWRPCPPGPASACGGGRSPRAGRVPSTWGGVHQQTRVRAFPVGALTGFYTAPTLESQA